MCKRPFPQVVALSVAWCPRPKHAHFSGGNIIVKQVKDYLITLPRQPIEGL